MDSTLRNLQLAGIAEDDLQTDLDGVGFIWVPPNAHLKEEAVFRGRNVEGEFKFELEKVSCVTYPLPEKGNQYLDREAIKVDENYTAYHIPQLQKAGWKVKHSTKGVLEDFVELADGDAGKVEQFVTRWGPLWYCQRHPECFWKISHRPYTTEPACLWHPREPIAAFEKYAKQAKAALDVVAHLTQDELPPPSYWEAFGMRLDVSPRLLDIKRDRPGIIWTVTTAVNRNLQLFGGPHLEIHWSNERPKLRINSGWGFFPAVWLQLAQLITGAKGLYVCVGCGKPYIRHKRKPVEGKSNYCDGCGVDKKAAKRDHARRKKNNSRI